MLEPSQICSSFISKFFKSDVDHNGINWKSVSTDVRNGYFGEFKAIEKGRDSTPMSQTDIDQCEAYFQAAGGEKKRRIYGLGSEEKNYYGQNLCGSSSLPPPFSQSTSITNMDEFVKQMMPALTRHLVPIIVEQVQASITPSGNPSIVTPIVPPATNVDEVDPSIQVMIVSLSLPQL
ncbi:hypothetical protein KY285_035737 [Solanum tuberosum]|nr:hypothetical protein KY289_035950 [Solanum tuberosum]KAH0639151.1 hypothetical protein KY285_035737 [Solanum tuberosum]